MKDIRYHSSDEMNGEGEWEGITEPVAVVIRADGSVDAYGYLAVIDQRPEIRAEQALRTLVRAIPEEKQSEETSTASDFLYDYIEGTGTE